jgi:hypothetical protein
MDASGMLCDGRDCALVKAVAVEDDEHIVKAVGGMSMSTQSHKLPGVVRDEAAPIEDGEAKAAPALQTSSLPRQPVRLAEHQAVQLQQEQQQQQ